jgi:hypothetical protein
MSIVLDDLERAWNVVSSIEPAAGQVRMLHEIARVSAALKTISRHAEHLELLEGEELKRVWVAVAMLYARSAALAIAASDALMTKIWLDAGEAWTEGTSIAAEFRDARSDPERFRKLHHDRWRSAPR